MYLQEVPNDLFTGDKVKRRDVEKFHVNLPRIRRARRKFMRRLLRDGIARLTEGEIFCKNV